MARFSTTISTPAVLMPRSTIWSICATPPNGIRGVVEAELVQQTSHGNGHIGEGTQFLVTLKVAGLPMHVTYQVRDYDRPRRVVLQANESAFNSVDTLTITPHDKGGSVVTYDAVLTASGVWRLLTPLLGLAFDRIGRRAEKGLQRELAG